jgi:hypothetical protein
MRARQSTPPLYRGSRSSERGGSGADDRLARLVK